MDGVIIPLHIVFDRERTSLFRVRGQGIRNYTFLTTDDRVQKSLFGGTLIMTFRPGTNRTTNYRPYETILRKRVMNP